MKTLWNSLALLITAVLALDGRQLHQLIFANRGCVLRTIPYFTQEAMAAADDNIRATVLRHVLGGRLQDKPIFLEIENDDPSSDLLQELGADFPRLKPIAQSEIKGFETALDPETGEFGAVLSIESIKRPDYLTVEVIGEDGGARFKYTLEWDRGWHVTNTSTMVTF